MRITRLKPEHIGQKIQCVIDYHGIRSEVTDGKIQFDNDRYYICQNVRDGASCKDKLGYQFTWSISSGFLPLQGVAYIDLIDYVPDYTREKVMLFKVPGLIKINQDI